MMRAGLIVCEYCDAVYQRRALAPGERAVCLRCDALLYRGGDLDLLRLLALTLSAAVVFAIANLHPIVSLELKGLPSQATLWGAIAATWDTGIGPVAVLAALTVFFFPLAQISLLGFVLTALLLRRPWPGLADALHALQAMRPWSMVEVFLLGALVAIVKIGALGSVHPQPGIFGFGALSLLLAALNSCDLHGFWDRLEQLS